MRTERIKGIIKQLTAQRVRITAGNISTQSLFTVGGTVSTAEAKEYLKAIK